MKTDAMTQTIETLIPHAGPMVLVDSITHWDPQHIRCEAHSHLNADNPMRQGGELSVFAGVEYAAQAMAAHARLVAEKPASEAAPRRGFIAVASRLKASVSKLDEIAAPLLIEARVVAQTSDSSLYEFTLYAGDTELLSGQLTAVLAPEAAPSA